MTRGTNGSPKSTGDEDTIAADSEQGIANDATLVDEGDSDMGAAATQLESTPEGRSARDAVPEELPVRNRSRYIRGAQIARGGMGAIVAVYDRELGRDIAIKELLLASPVFEKRFLREIRITTRLAHPSIIGVYEAGRWPDGKAFYAMKKVAGRALDRVIAERKTLADRLALLPQMIAVVDALAYAHSEGIIHRDLKPANVLAGDFGETVVIDWGLAKDLRDSSSGQSIDEPWVVNESLEQTLDESSQPLTVLGETMGTPAYMPPEQARGEVVDERADVYALGAMLYHLLSGEVPYQNSKVPSLQRLLDEVRERAPTPLSSLVSEVPEDLLTLVAKAMARDPAKRYAHAGELAEELKRFEAGLRVRAHEYSSAELFRRWLGRHRAAVSVASIMALILALVIVLSFVRIGHERDVAAEQRREAQANRDEVEELLDFMLIDLREKLMPIGKLDLLEMVAQKAATYYAGRPVDLSQLDEARKRATTHYNLGDVLSAQGNLDGALAQYRAGLDISSHMRAQEPDNEATKKALWLGYMKLGDIHRSQGKLEEAMEQYRASIAISQALGSDSSSSTRWQRNLSINHNNLGDILRSQGQLDGALQEYRNALAINGQLLEQEPDSGDWQRNQSINHNYVGNVLREQGRLEDALQEYRAAKSLSEKLVAQDPENSQRQRELSVCYENVGDVLQDQRDFKGALQQFQEAQAISERLAKQDPSNSRWQRDVSIGNGKIGDILRRQGDLSGALAQYESSLAIRKRLVSLDASNSLWQRDVSIGYENIGDTLQLKGDRLAAVQPFRDSLAIRERLGALDPSNQRWKQDLAGAYLKLGAILMSDGDADEGQSVLSKSAILFTELAGNADGFYNAACVHALSHNPDKAFEMLEQSVQHGWDQADFAAKDSDLLSLHEDPRWQSLLERMGPAAK